MTVEPLELSGNAAVTPIHRGLEGPSRAAYSVGYPTESLHPHRIVVVGAATAIVEALAAGFAGHAGLEVVSTATSETDLFELIARRQVDGIVLYVPDLKAETTGVVNRLKLHDPALRIVVLTAHATPHTLAQAAAAGVAACLSLNARLRDLAEAIRAETTDTMLVDAASLSAPAVVPGGEADRVAASLTRRELEVLGRLADGCSPQVIAAELIISIYTARGHVKRVLRKLGVHSQLEAVATARRLGLVDSSSAAESKNSPGGAGQEQITPIAVAGDGRLLGWRRHG